MFLSYGVSMPLTCPLHFLRDPYHGQEGSKQFFRSDLWTCDVCEKAFTAHAHLDRHMAAKQGHLVKYVRSGGADVIRFQSIPCSVLQFIIRQIRNVKNRRHNLSGMMDIYGSHASCSSTSSQSASLKCIGRDQRVSLRAV